MPIIDSLSCADVADPERFIRVDVADAQNAAQTREYFGRWLQRYFDLDPIRLSDLVLAANEALANSAEFAYLRSHEVGAVGLRAVFEPADATLTVTISDNGLWRIPDPSPATRARGRGITLMRALADRAAIETSSDGTEVCLVWNGVVPLTD